MDNNDINRSTMSHNTSSSSTSNDNHSSTLLQIVTELRVDLERAIGKIRQLESDNHQLKENVHNLKDENNDFRKKYDEVSDTYLTTLSEKLEAERQSESFLEHVKQQLIEKTKEFELLRDKFAPQDIDYIRLKIQEEMELVHKQAMTLKDSEINSLTDQVYLLKREVSGIKNEYELEISSSRKHIELLKEECSITVSSLKDEMQRLKDKLNLIDREELTRKFRIKEAEQQYTIDLLKDELTSTKEKLDSTVYMTEEEKAKKEEIILRLKASAITTESSLLALEQKYNLLLSSSDHKDIQFRSLQVANDELKSEVKIKSKQLMDKENRIESLIEEANIEKLDLKKRYEGESYELQHMVDQLTLQITNREELLRRAQRDVAEMQLRVEVADGDVRRSNQISSQEHNKKISLLELEVIESNNRVRKLELQHSSVMEEQNKDLNNLRSDYLRLKRENEALIDKIRRKEYSNEEEKMKTSSLKSELTIKSNHLQKLLDDSISKYNQLEHKLAVNQGVIHSLEVHNEKLQSEYQLSLHEIQKESMKHIRLVQQECLNKLEAAKQKFRRNMLKEKKIAEAIRTNVLTSM